MVSEKKFVNENKNVDEAVGQKQPGVEGVGGIEAGVTGVTGVTGVNADFTPATPATFFRGGGEANKLQKEKGGSS